MFVADAEGLDFLNSVASPVDTVVDWITDGEGLLDWLLQANLVSKETLNDLRGKAVPGELDKVATQARNLREWFRGFVQEHKGRPLTGKAIKQLEPLNQILERDESYSQLLAHEKGAGPLELRKMRRWRSPESLLIPIAEILAKFVCDEDFTHVKACEGHHCTLMFADHTNRHARRWCSMAICGNRAKQIAHRNRVSARK